MKKLMVVASAIALAAVANAGTFTWGSGAMYTAASAAGGWSNTAVHQANPAAEVLMSVFVLTDDADLTTGKTAAQKYAELAAKDQAGLYDWAKGQTATYTAENKNTAGGIIAANTVKKTDAANSTTYYSIIIAEYTDAKFGDMYMATAASGTTTSSGSYTLSNIFGGAATATTGGIRDWQAVPEPTSGLLLLLGVAGLALRRRRA